MVASTKPMATSHTVQGPPKKQPAGRAVKSNLKSFFVMPPPSQRRGMRRGVLSFFGGLAISFVAIMLFLRRSAPAVAPAPKHGVTVALLVSGAARGPAVLRCFASSLRQNVIHPFGQQQSANVQAFVWLQDAAAEHSLCHLLSAERGRSSRFSSVQLCVTRDAALRDFDAPQAGRHASLHPPAGSRRADDEMATVAADHPPSAYPQGAWRADRSPNTLRMLHKWRGVEWLRLQTLARRGDDQHPHTWVLRSTAARARSSRLPPTCYPSLSCPS